jgi:segregation and condensation protein A
MSLGDSQGEAKGEVSSLVDSVVREGSGGYAVKLPVFEGPLDLLLHLIRQNEMEITDIPIAQVSAQYLEYLELMRSLDLDIAGEYLLMAATLALIKSRMLLPPDEEDEAAEEADPRDELVARLLEYQRYKEVAEQLGRRRLLGRDVFAAQGAESKLTAGVELGAEVGVFELLDALRKLLEEASQRETTHEVEKETITVRQCMLDVMAALEGEESIEFAGLFRRGQGAPVSRALVVATFLAILELVRLNALSAYQGLDEVGAPVGTIRLRRLEQDPHGEGRPTWHERISDLM